ncbi:MAG: SH3 domain-containing protein [Clostridiales bacterium]|nr:SH3 domain-containing protein [Clostridiales bacterium]
MKIKDYDDKGLFDEKKKKAKVRNYEGKIDLPDDKPEIKGDYGQAENMLDMWGLDKEEATLGRKKRRRFIRLGIAILAAIIVVVSIFYILPAVLPGLFKGTNIELFVEKKVNLEYNESYRVVNYYCADLMTEPDPTSERITQVLYNEPVILVDGQENNGYVKIRTTDGIEGYVKNFRLTDSTESVEPDLHLYKLIVSDTYKNVMTHASNGTLITKVMMNTVLYADVKRDGVYQVALPNGDKGWIGSSGVIELGTRENTQKVSCRYFVSSVLSQSNATYIDNGLTLKGLSVNGLVYICADVNGVKLPRSMQEQSQMGQEVELQYDVVTGDLLLDSIEPGDLVFLKSPYSESDEIYEMGVCTDTGVLLMVSQAKTTIRLRTFKATDDIAQRIVSVRRIFEE